MNRIIFIPGLGDRKNLLSSILKWFWGGKEFEAEIFLFGWNAPESALREKQKRLLERIEELTRQGYQISLVGISAGGSAAINAFLERPEIVRQSINVCGRLYVGEGTIPSLKKASRRHPVFAASVKDCEGRLQDASHEVLARILTIRPVLYDGAVPLSTMIVEGAVNAKILCMLHLFSIPAILIFQRKKITKFIASS